MLLKPNVGRALSAIGALVVVLALFMTWYHVTKGTTTDDTTGWQTFTRLRFVILAGALVTWATVAVPQSRGALVVRTVVGVVVALLVLRRIIDPPANASAAFGVYVGVVGALAVAAGGLVDSGREIVEVYPNLRRPPAGELGRGARSLDAGDDPAESRR